jgi:hypothetical protein
VNFHGDPSGIELIYNDAYTESFFEPKLQQQFSSCHHDAKTNEPTMVDLHFVNRTYKPKYIYWVSYSGHRYFYMKLEPEQNYVQRSCLGEYWVMSEVPL